MVERTNCKYFYYYNKKVRGIDSPTVDFIQMPRCKKRMIVLGGCREDCEEFKSK